MAKKIILLSDGTGNSAGKVWRTNVWRLFQSLDLKGATQIAVYDDGVGTSSFKPLAILGGGFGWGLKRNVLNLYKFLCRNYQPGDEIYAFGFSRGAFTIRVVVGLVLNQGLVHFANEAELDKKARAAFRAYRHDKYPVWNLQYPFRLIQFWMDKRFYKSCETPINSIEFVGVWDTVAAYGLPIDAMTRGVSEWLWPLELPNKTFNKNIRKARHALAIDDERASFHPVLWDEEPANTQPSVVRRPTSKEQLLQVLSAGVHSNVGGGYARDPAWFFVGAFLVAFLTWISAKLAASIKDRMRLLWIKYLPASNQPVVAKSPPVASPFQSVVFVGLILYLLCYPLFGQTRGLGWLTVPASANEILLAYTAQPVRPVLAAFLVFYFLPSVWVRKLREWPAYQATLRGFKYYLAPALSAAGLLYLAVAFGNHYHFNMRDSLGSFCTDRPELNAHNDGFKRAGSEERAELIFDTSPDSTNTPNSLCVSTGVFLKTGTRYRVSVKRLPEEDDLAPSGKWSFFGEESYMGGQPVSHLSPLKSAALALLFPLRRTFDRPWGSIILRIGGKGNEENFLDRVPPKQTDELLPNADFAVPEKSESLAEGFTPKRDGELFIYLNKPVLGLWGYESFVSAWGGRPGKGEVTAEK